MEASPEGPMDMNEAADRLERTLSDMSLPIRIQGGQVREGGVRYMVTPMNGTRPEQIQDVEGSIALALGVRGVHIAREGHDLAIDVPAHATGWPRLLSLLEAIGDLPAFTLVAGSDDRGAPVLIPPREPDTWHVAILGKPGLGKSELLRSLVFSLALTNRQSTVQLFGIDLSGRELVVLEALPHGLADLATEPRFANELLAWLMEEGARRERFGILRPDLVLAIDDSSRLVDSDRSAEGQLRQLALHGRRWGIHLLLAGLPVAKGSSPPWDKSPGWAIVKGEEEPGRFTLTTRLRALPFSAAWLSASDLNLAVQQVRTGGRPGRPGLFYSVPRREWKD